MASSFDSLPTPVDGSAAPLRSPRWNPIARLVRDRRGIAIATSALLLLAVATRIWTAVWDQGLVWPDEIYQTLEQAHRFAFGRGIIPWEFRDGARSWVYPGMIGLVWKAAAALGVKSGLGLVQLAKLIMGALSVGGVWAGMRLARKLGGERAELVAALFGALCPLLVIFGSRCSTEAASAPLVVFAALLLEVTPLRRRAAFAGALMACTVLFRYQNGLLAAGFFVLLCARRRWTHALSYLGGALLVASLGGGVDWVTWGSPFRPLVVYVKFNVIDKGAERWGTSPFPFFSEHLATSIGLSYSLMLLGFGVAVRKARGLVLVVLVFVLVHSAIPHKELRFITPIVPLGLSLAAVGLTQLFDGLRRGSRPTYALCLVCGAQMAWQLKAPTLGDLGYGTDSQVVWHANEDYYRATIAAAAAPDLCGISYVDNARAWTGGYTYLHRAVPVFFDTEPRNLAAANYLVGGHEEKLPPAWHALDAYGEYTLWRRDGACGPTPVDWTLNML